MKRTLIIITVLLLALGLNAAPKDEAIEAIDTAKTLINKDDYIKAKNEIDFALSKINEILAEQLLAYIPEGSGGFKLENKAVVPLNIMGTSITASGEYTNGDSSFDLTISAGGLLGQSAGLLGFANLFGAVGTTGKTIRVSGYTGTQDYDAEDMSGTLTVKVNDRVTVVVTGENIKNADLLKTLAEKVDFSKLEKAY